MAYIEKTIIAGEHIFKEKSFSARYGKKNIPERKIDEEYYHRGDVVIVNDNLAHYRGEVQIVLKDMKVDGQRNRIGHIPEADHILLNEVKAGRSFCFMNK